MIILSFLRVLKFSLQDIGRNIWLSIVTITIIVLALFTVNLLLVVNEISQAAVESVKEKIDVVLYIKPEAEESKIFTLKAKISNLEQIKEVKYISQNEAMDNFKNNHRNNPEILQALREIGGNPLTPSLTIKPVDVDKYEEIIAELSAINNEIIESRNFDDHKIILEKINAISYKVKEAGIFVSSIFVLIALLVVYNAIRVVIYTHRKEIGIMKLVGASNWFIRSPYLISSIVYALIGIIATLLIFYPFLTILQPYLEAFFIGYNINIISYFTDNFIKIFGLELLVASLINVFASLIAVGKYSKV